MCSHYHGTAFNLHNAAHVKKKEVIKIETKIPEYLFKKLYWVGTKKYLGNVFEGHLHTKRFFAALKLSTSWNLHVNYLKTFDWLRIKTYG